MSWDGDDVWDELLDADFPEGDGLITVLRSYVDASTRPEHGLLSVAAYLIESGRVRRFRRQWRDTFGDKNFSWADLIGCSKHFKPLRENRTDHGRLVAAGVSLVREYVIAGSIASCWLQDVENHSPTWIKGFGHAYSIAGHMAITGMGNWAKHNDYRGGIEYIIEAGDDGYDQLNHLLSYASKVPEIADMYQWAGHSTKPKTPCSPFHAPDLLAWEWGKYWQETVVERKRKMRLSLAHLLIGKLENYSLQHLGGDPLVRFFNQIAALGVEQWNEEQLEAARAALAPVSSVDVTESVEASAQKEPVGGHE